MARRRGLQADPCHAREYRCSAEISGAAELKYCVLLRHNIGAAQAVEYSLTEAEQNLARIETQLAAMQENIDAEHQPEQEPEPVGAGRVLSVEDVRSHQPAMGIRAHTDRAPSEVSPPGSPSTFTPPSPRL